MKTPEKYRCPYNDFNCPTSKSNFYIIIEDCEKCKDYHKGVKETGGVPILGYIIELIKTISKKLKNK